MLLLRAWVVGFALFSPVQFRVIWVSAKEKTRAIKEANEKIDMLTADIEKYTADAAMLTKEIAGHDEDIS
eukprot:6305242-Alexandrium_andersonii.AAC.1